MLNTRHFITGVAKKGTLNHQYPFFWLTLFLFLSTGLYAGQPDTCLDNQQQLKRVKDWKLIDKIIDGDTIHTKDGTKIRFIGINTMEIGRNGAASQPYAIQAYQYLKSTLKGIRQLGLIYDREREDKYNRTLAYLVLPDGRNLGQLLLAQGLAFSIIVPPNDAQISCYRAIEKAARDAGKGIWQLPEFQILEADSLSGKVNGYRIINGHIMEYSQSRRYYNLELSKQLVVKIKKDLIPENEVQHFKKVGNKLQVRGWVHQSKGKYVLKLASRKDIALH